MIVTIDTKLGRGDILDIDSLEEIKLAEEIFIELIANALRGESYEQEPIPLEQ
jgi:hypothetical protein